MYNIAVFCGVIAQLGERLHGMQEVTGSIPVSSLFIHPLFGHCVIVSGFPVWRR